MGAPPGPPGLTFYVDTKGYRLYFPADVISCHRHSSLALERYDETAVVLCAASVGCCSLPPSPRVAACFGVGCYHHRLSHLVECPEMRQRSSVARSGLISGDPGGLFQNSMWPVAHDRFKDETTFSLSVVVGVLWQKVDQMTFQGHQF